MTQQQLLSKRELGAHETKQCGARHTSGIRHRISFTNLDAALDSFTRNLFLPMLPKTAFELAARQVGQRRSRPELPAAVAEMSRHLLEVDGVCLFCRAARRESRRHTEDTRYLRRKTAFVRAVDKASSPLHLLLHTSRLLCEAIVDKWMKASSKATMRGCKKNKPLAFQVTCTKTRHP